LASIVALAERDAAVDLVTVAAELKGRGMLHSLPEGEQYLHKLAHAVTGSTLANVDQYLEDVRRHAKQRQAIQTAVEIQARAYRAPTNLEFLDDGIADLTRIRSAAAVVTLPALAHDDVIETYARPLPEPVPTGFPRVDAMIGEGGRDVVLVCGSTGAGKSAYATQIAITNARTRSVLYCTTELPRRQLYARVGAHLFSDSWLRILKSDAMMGRSLAVAMRGLHLRVVEVRTVDDLLRAVDAVAQSEGAPPFLIVDYLQNFGRATVNEDRRHVISAASDAITTWTRSTGGCALVVSSVSRSMYQTDDRLSPDDFLAAAKESGDLEYDASTVLFLAVPKPAFGCASDGRLIVAKARFGGVGAVGMRFDGPTGKFTELAEADLTGDERAVLDAVRAGAKTQEDIARAVGCRKDAIGLVQDRLAQVGLIGARSKRRRRTQ
jgi:replicative DNA helicase